MQETGRFTTRKDARIERCAQTPSRVATEPPNRILSLELTPHDLRIEFNAITSDS